MQPCMHSQPSKQILVYKYALSFLVNNGCLMTYFFVIIHTRHRAENSMIYVHRLDCTLRLSKGEELPSFATGRVPIKEGLF